MPEKYLVVEYVKPIVRWVDLKRLGQQKALGMEIYSDWNLIMCIADEWMYVITSSGMKGICCWKSAICLSSFSTCRSMICE